MAIGVSCLSSVWLMLSVNYTSFLVMALLWNVTEPLVYVDTLLRRKEHRTAGAGALGSNHISFLLSTQQRRRAVWPRHVLYSRFAAHRPQLRDSGIHVRDGGDP